MYDSRKDTNKHISLVCGYINMFIDELEQRKLLHDKSKLESPEKEIFDEFTPKLSDTTYGTDEYYFYLKEMKPALDHHYANNRHHPEYHHRGIKDMTLHDIVEMYCDWQAGTQRMRDGDMINSIDHNKNRFKMSEELAEIFKNTYEFYSKQ